MEFHKQGIWRSQCGKGTAMRDISINPRLQTLSFGSKFHFGVFLPTFLKQIQPLCCYCVCALLCLYRVQQDRQSSNGAASSSSNGNSSNGVSSSNGNGSKGSKSGRTTSSNSGSSSSQSKPPPAATSPAAAPSSSKAAKASSKRTLGLFERQEYEVRVQ
jgi:hypothetical protein